MLIVEVGANELVEVGSPIAWTIIADLWIDAVQTFRQQLSVEGNYAAVGLLYTALWGNNSNDEGRNDD